jgi:hypothetical protein
MNKHPHQIVKEKFGSKQKLAESLAAALPKREGQGKEAALQSLKRTSNTKLLRLKARLEKKSS